MLLGAGFGLSPPSRRHHRASHSNDWLPRQIAPASRQCRSAVELPATLSTPLALQGEELVWKKTTAPYWPHHPPRQRPFACHGAPTAALRTPPELASPDHQLALLGLLEEPLAASHAPADLAWRLKPPDYLHLPRLQELTASLQRPGEVFLWLPLLAVHLAAPLAVSCSHWQKSCASSDDSPATRHAMWDR